MEVAGFAALSLGLVFVGDCHAASAEAILQARAGWIRGMGLLSFRTGWKAAPCHSCPAGCWVTEVGRLNATMPGRSGWRAAWRALSREAPGRGRLPEG